MKALMIQRISPTAILLSALHIQSNIPGPNAQCQNRLISDTFLHSISFELAQIWLYSRQIRHLCQGTPVGCSKMCSTLPITRLRLRVKMEVQPVHSPIHFGWPNHSRFT